MTKILDGFDENGNRLTFADLAEEEQNALVQFYDSVGLKNERRMMIMARESSIQLIYQNALTPFLIGHTYFCTTNLGIL